MSARKSDSSWARYDWFTFLFAAALAVLLLWLFLSRAGTPPSGAAGPAAADQGPASAVMAEGGPPAAAPAADSAQAAPADGVQAAPAADGVQAVPAPVITTDAAQSAPGAVQAAVPPPAAMPETLPACQALDVGCGAVAAAGAPAIQLRAAPALSAPVSAEVPAGTPLMLLEVLQGGPEGTWWRLFTAGGVEGWVNGDSPLSVSGQ